MPSPAAVIAVKATPARRVANMLGRARTRPCSPRGRSLAATPSVSSGASFRGATFDEALQAVDGWSPQTRTSPASVADDGVEAVTCPFLADGPGTWFDEQNGAVVQTFSRGGGATQ